MLINANMPLRFKQVELQYFNWLYSVAPCFPVSSSKINILCDPKTFYDTLCNKFRNAKKRISIASLYIGTGNLEKKLLLNTKENIGLNKTVKFDVLLDYQRGTRGEVNSVTLLQDFIKRPEQCRISLYQTPRLQGSWSKALPSRYNEIVGLQHMKLYIADDSVMLSGANCSNDYFEQRQDRYIEIEDADLANFYRELIDKVSTFSKTCYSDGIQSNSSGNKKVLVTEIKKQITDLIFKWKEQQILKLSELDSRDVAKMDTWVFPLIQMGEFNVTQDEEVTNTFLTSVPKGSYIRMATGYFNLTENYAGILLNKCKANISMLMAHPNANGFLGASGPAGGIPFAYSLIAKKFWDRVVDSNQSSRLQMLEYERPGWTFHAKGLWYYPPGSGVPWATVVGSGNLGERSVRRDLEAQAAIFTASPDLQKRLHEEATLLHEYANECSDQLQKRETPLWVKASVGLFRTYF